jgi:N-acetyl-anhydromuramyl-L-alanine amidase AmpD
MDRVTGVKTADTGEDITALINTSAEQHGLAPTTLLALMIAESGLHTGPAARRERAWPDVSYGLIQQTVWTIHPDCGLPLTRGTGQLVFDTPENRRLVRDWLEVPTNAIPYAARHLVRIARAMGETEPLRMLSRWNAPARTLEENEAAQPASIANYRRGLAEAERSRATEATMPDQPAVNWVGSPNFQAGRGGRQPIAIVCHIMDGTLDGCDSWFKNPAAQVSAHFGVGKQGEIHQYVKVEDTAWANGRLNRPDLSVGWIADAVRDGVNPNLITVSIEHEGKPNDDMPEAQYRASLALILSLCRRFNIPADRQHIVAHAQIDSVTRPNCPGPKYPWPRLMEDLGQMNQPPADPDALWSEMARTGASVRDAASTLVEVAAPGNTAVTSQQALDEAYRIAGLWQEAATSVRDLTLRLKG